MKQFLSVREFLNLLLEFLFNRIGMKAGIRDAENENLLTEYQNKIAELREQNKQLKQRLILSQQQMQAAQQIKKSNTMYESVSSRIDTVRNTTISSFEKNSNLCFRVNQNECHRLYFIIFV